MSYLDELFSLKGKTAIVTGGGRGIGQVVALGLSKAQADIVILSRSDASQTIKLINDNGGKCCHIKCDVTDENAVNNAMEKILNNSKELIPAILYLCSDASGYTTGSDIIVDGGYVCF